MHSPAYIHPSIGLLICFTATFFLMVVLNFIASWRWSKSSHLHWTERARLLFPARRTTPLNLIFLTGCSVLFGLNFSTRHSPTLILFALAGFLGCVLGNVPLERKILPHVTAREWTTQILSGWGSRALLFGPFLAVTVSMPREWNAQLITIAVLFAIFYLWFGSVGYFQLLIWLKLLKAAKAEILNLLEECFATTGVRPRAVWTMQSPLALAFAVPTRKELLFTDSFFTQLAADEIKAVTYHELAHLTEDKLTIARRMLGLLVFYPFIFTRPLMATWGFAGFLPVYLLFFFLLFLNVRLAKKMEHRADAEAINRQNDEGTYARALETIYRLNLIPAVMPTRGQVHPHLYDRMLAAGVTPDFPRPKAPGTFHWTILVPAILLASFIIARL